MRSTSRLSARCSAGVRRALQQLIQAALEGTGALGDLIRQQRNELWPLVGQQPSGVVFDWRFCARQRCAGAAVFGLQQGGPSDGIGVSSKTRLATCSASLADRFCKKSQICDLRQFCMLVQKHALDVTQRLIFVQFDTTSQTKHQAHQKPLCSTDNR